MPGLAATSDERATIAEVQRLARGLLPRGRELADIVTGWVLEAVPGVAPAEVPAALDVVHESTEQNIGAVLAVLAYGAMPEKVEPPPGTLEVVRQTLAVGGDLATVLRAYHLGHAYVCRLWLDHVGREIADPQLTHAVVTYASDRMFAYFDAACEHLRGRFLAELPGSAGPLDRRAAIDALLTGGPHPAAGKVLGYDLDQHHLGIVAAPASSAADVAVAVAHLLERLPCRQRVVEATGDGTVWAWAGFPRPPGEAVLAQLAHATVTSVYVGIGEVGHGADGFRRTHTQAVDAGRVLRLRPGASAGIARQRDIELAALLCADQDRAREVAADRLGPLAARDAAGTRLRTTVRAYLDGGRSKAGTAARLEVHTKTVAYRIAQAEQLLGRTLEANTADLEAALLIDLTLAGP